MADKKQRTALWKGLNRMPYIGDGEMRDMRNLSSDAYPFTTTRKGRKPYKFDIYIPSPEGEAYRDAERLPKPCDEEMEKVYKLTESYAEDEYISGRFYYYDTSTKTWVWGIKDADFKGTVTDVIRTENSKITLYGNALYLHEFSGCEYPYNEYGKKLNICVKVKYLGEDTDEFKWGKTYIYRIRGEAYWESGRGDNQIGASSTYTENMHPRATEQYANSDSFFYYQGKVTEEFPYTNQYYRCRLKGYGYWEECEDVYEVAGQIPENPEDGEQIRYFNNYYGAPLESAYYTCGFDTNTRGEKVFFYTKSATATEYTSVTFLQEATEEKLGKSYYYAGIQKGQFAKCDQDNGEYIWLTVSHPKVKRTVTIAESLEKYKDITLKQIIEIIDFRGMPAAIFVTEEGEYKLYYDESTWDLNDVTKEPGKKLSVIGNKLVVGENGSYLYLNKGSKIFNKASPAIAKSITAGYALYGNGQTNSKDSYIYGSSTSGEAIFVFYVQGGEGYGYKEVYEALKTAGTSFSANFNGKTYYLTSQSAEYKPNNLIYAWSVNDWHYDYADILTIRATGVTEEFEWYLSENKYRPIEVTIKSTNSQHKDVVAWKKRLWGYSENVLYGTITDIFNKNGIVDWVTGDNTYTEAIAQPLWQGGDITGIAALMNGLVCFKEDCLTVVTGNYPAIMSSQTIPCRGLPPENRESIAVANECVYYMSTDGVYRFDGSIPRCISRNAKIFGTEAVGASDGNKYWLSLKEESGDYALYVYDINYDIWHKEDATQAASFAVINGEMHMAVGTEIYNLNSPREDVQWECEFWYDEDTHLQKKYKEIIVRGNVGDCELYLKADDGEWKFIGAVCDKMRMKFIPFDCEELSLKLKGKGKCEIKSIERIFEVVV